MPMSSNFAGYARSTSRNAPDEDPDLEKKPENMDAETHDVVSDRSRLMGAKGLTYLKSRST
jgi:hypothetical protein